MAENGVRQAGDDEAQDETEPPQAAGKLLLWRALPLALLIVGGGTAWFAFDVGAYLSFDVLRDNREWLLAQADEHVLLSALASVAIYALATAFSLPVGSILTILAGFLFGTWMGTCYVVIGATLGALAVFLAARTALSDYFHAKVGKSVLRMERGFQENPLSYMLVLRLVPIFPFWLVNLVPALLGVSPRIYALGTMIGIIPGTFVYASVGNGLGEIFDRGETPDFGIIYDVEVLTPLLGLAALSLLPVVYKRWRAAGRAA